MAFFLEHHPPSRNDQYYFDCIDKALDICNNNDKVRLTVDFNAEEVEIEIEIEFWNWIKTNFK